MRIVLQFYKNSYREDKNVRKKTRENIKVKFAVLPGTRVSALDSTNYLRAPTKGP